MSRKLALGLSAIALAVGAFGCSGARSHVTAPTAEYPISMSDGIRDESGAPVADEDKQVVGYFQYDYKAWGMWWRMISFTGDKDLSEEMNKQVKAAGGEGVINLTVKAENCTWNIFTFVGLFPDCSTVRVRGNIIKRKPKAEVASKPPVLAPPPAAPAPPPAAPPPAAPAAP
ncbi:MAG: hypothetical protein HYV09_18805, partial [Deltaproteobacteria bacterium]|nr:hypothetical protein [Deltaproteobacteria bacterium]